MNAEDMARYKAREMRYKKPIVKGLTLYDIKNDVYDIMSECNDVRYFIDDYDDKTLLDALDGDEEEAYEFKMLFSDLSAECERFADDLEYDENLPECFDTFFASVSSNHDTLLGFDSYEGDYYGLNQYEQEMGREAAQSAMLHMTKKELINTAADCFKVFQSYIGVKYRYDCLKASMDILTERNAGFLECIKAIDAAWEKAQTEPAVWGEFDSIVAALPDKAWVE